jgi:flagellar M-ring protein FliF
MAERFKAIVNKIVEIWKSWTAKQRVILISSVAVVAVAIGIIAWVASRPTYETLCVCEDYKEMNSVTTLLTSNNIPYKISDSTLTVQVGKSNLTTAKMLIASEDIQPAGYTFDDAMNSSFTTTESDRTKMYAHYLESKLESDLEDWDGIKSASITVQLADTTSSFYATTSEASVSASLETSKTVDDDYAETIANYLATAVGNSSTNNITVVDTKGNTLFSGPSNASTNSGVSYAGKLKYKTQIETTTKTNLKQGLLATGLYDDVYMTMNLDMDWDAVTTIAEEYTTQGDDQAIFGSSYEESSTGTSGASGTPGTTSNSDDTTYDITTGESSTSTYNVKQYEYLPNKLTTTTVKEPGEIVLDSSTLAVTLIKNVMYNEEECKELGLLDDMTWEEFQAANADTIPLDVDQTIIDNIAAGTGISADNISVIAYQRPWFTDKDNGNILSNVTFWLQILLAAVILGILVFVVIRSAVPLTVNETEPELSVEEMLATTREKQPTVEDIDMQEKSETRKAIEKFVDENPEAVALLLRNWLNEGWN